MHDYEDIRKWSKSLYSVGQRSYVFGVFVPFGKIVLHEEEFALHHQLKFELFACLTVFGHLGVP